jgi:hypothetical protein
MRTIAAVAALALVAPALARADEAGTRKAARAAMARYGPALVTVRLTVKSRMVFEGREQASPEYTLDVQGTVIAPDGLTVVADSASNPASMFQGGEDDTRFETETSEAKLVLQDGREFAARFVLRDEGLDLAFLAPVSPVPALPCVRFDKAPVPAPLDDLVLLSQLGRSLNREVGVTLGHVRAVVKKPRTFVVPGLLDGLLGRGGPAFDGAGRPVGLVVLRRSPRSQADGPGGRDPFDGMNAVVLAGADVQEIAGQAQAARAKMVGQGDADAAP